MRTLSKKQRTFQEIVDRVNHQVASNIYYRKCSCLV